MATGQEPELIEETPPVVEDTPIRETPLELELFWHRAMLADALRIFREMRDDDPYQGIHSYFDEIDDYLESAR